MNTNVGDMPLDIFSDYVSDTLGEDWCWEYFLALNWNYIWDWWTRTGDGKVIDGTGYGYGEGEGHGYSGIGKGWGHGCNHKGIDDQ